MADLPFIPFYVDDFEAHTAHLSLAEDGAYNRLLRLCWRQPDCSIPADFAWIRRMMRCSEEEFSTVIVPVIGEYFTEARGRYFQKRQRKEFQKSKDLLEARKSAGKKGGKAKAQKSKDNPPSTATDLPEANAQQNSDTDLASRTITRTITNTPPYGGVGEARPDAAKDFAAWEQTLSAVEGVKGSGLEISPYSAMVLLKNDGFDLATEVIPILKADIARATAQNRTNRMSWQTIANRVREARSTAYQQATAPPPPKTPAATATATAVKLDPTVSWDDRMSFARRLRKWPAQWGPKPNEPGCLVPETLVLPSDGKDWGEWKPGEAA